MKPLSCLSHSAALEVDLLHLQQRRHGPLGPRAVRVADQALHHGGHDLPRHAESVLEPAALLRLGVAAFAQRVPEVVHLPLVPAGDPVRDGLGEPELGPPLSAVNG
jgi:hypothetical protein